MIRVLHLRQGTGLYGAERAVLALAQATLAPFEPLIGTLVRPLAPDTLGDEARKRGLAALCFESASRFDLRCARRVAQAALEQDVQLLHAHDFKALFVALGAGLLARVPVVATYHGDTGSTRAVRVYEVVARLLGNFTRGAAVVSRALETRLRRWAPLARVSFVPNGLLPPRPIGEAERAEARARFGVEGQCLAVIGRLSPEKGHAVLLEALRGLQQPPLLLVAGDGPLRESLQAAARDLPVSFLGYLDDPRAVFAAADAVVIPSHTEGLPLVALEALALGKPVVASAVGELPSLLQGGAGLLVPPGDARALTTALESLQHLAPAALHERALARAGEFDARAMARSYAALYSGALSGLALPTPSSSR